jgi:rubrerythrin
MKNESPIATWLDRRFLDRLVATPRGRAFVLGFMADAEESDEQGVFDTLLARVDDPELSRLVRIHRDDETRHAQMLRDRIAKVGVAPIPTPDDVRIVIRLNRMLGDFGENFVDGRRTVMEAYTLLLVIEERGVRQFPKIARALRKHDPESANVIDRITRDEERHVLYARAISKRYAPDAATLETTLARYRATEEIAFEDNGRALMRHVMQNDLLAVSRAERIFWRGMSALTSALPAAQPALQAS